MQKQKNHMLRQLITIIIAIGLLPTFLIAQTSMSSSGSEEATETTNISSFDDYIMDPTHGNSLINFTLIGGSGG